jgi:hypothetical protein
VLLLVDVQLDMIAIADSRVDGWGWGVNLNLVIKSKF